MSTETADIADLVTQSQNCPRCGRAPSRVYPPKHYNYPDRGPVTIRQSYCGHCRDTFSTWPRRRAQPRPRVERPKPIAAYTLADVLADPEPWATARYPSHRWRHLRGLILDRDGHRCQLLRDGHPCGRQATEVDHDPPRATGGTHHPASLRAACAECNLAAWVNRPDHTRPAAPATLTARQAEIVELLDRVDAPRWCGRTQALRLLAAAGQTAGATGVAAACAWRHHNPPGTPPPVAPHTHTPRPRAASTTAPTRPRTALVATLIDALDNAGVRLDIGPTEARRQLDRHPLATAVSLSTLDTAQRYRRRDAI